MRIMGIDVGTKNIGVAVSDEMKLIACGCETIIRKTDGEVFDRLIAIAGELNVEEIVIGMPINMNGTKGPKAEESVRFKEGLEQRTSIPVRLWDERLSTKEADAIMLEADLSRSKRKKNIDRIAAQIILQGYLDYLNRDKTT